MQKIRLSAQPRTGLDQISVLALGFRPFFLAAGAAAVVAIAVWLAMLRGDLAAAPGFDGVTWHAHEMLFGYAGAVIAGFLLTATRNWTGMETPTGARLAALAMLWLSARAAPWMSAPPALAAGLDIAFFPVLALSLWRPLWAGSNRTNRVFLVILAGMGVASALVHIGIDGIAPPMAARGNRLMLDLIVVTLLLVAGRVMPFFAEQGLEGANPVTRTWVERLTFAIAIALLVANLLDLAAHPTGLLAVALGLVQVVRLAGWHDRRAWTKPILGVLYSGFGWLSLGLVLDGLSAFLPIPPTAALHAITAGGFGVFTLGMMARVTLGHTGRTMHASGLTVLAFVLANTAALLRAIAPMLFPGAYLDWIFASGICWMLAFGLFLWIYGPMLVRPRADGRPG
ncbi:MAG: NnrS family protein [Chromatiaceae bacterium]